MKKKSGHIARPTIDKAKNAPGKMTPLHNKKFSGKQPKGQPDMQNSDMGGDFKKDSHGLYGGDSKAARKTRKPKAH